MLPISSNYTSSFSGIRIEPSAVSATAVTAQPDKKESNLLDQLKERYPKFRFLTSGQLMQVEVYGLLTFFKKNRPHLGLNEITALNKVIDQAVLESFELFNLWHQYNLWGSDPRDCQLHLAKLQQMVASIFSTIKLCSERKKYEQKMQELDGWMQILGKFCADKNLLIKELKQEKSGGLILSVRTMDFYAEALSMCYWGLEFFQSDLKDLENPLKQLWPVYLINFPTKKCYKSF